MTTAQTDIIYSPHRLQVTAQGTTSTLTVQHQVMPLYGPEEWFDCEPTTVVSAPLSTTAHA